MRYELRSTGGGQRHSMSERMYADPTAAWEAAMARTRAASDLVFYVVAVPGPADVQPAAVERAVRAAVEGDP